MKRRDIADCDGNPYLTRWTLFSIGEWFEIYFHKFHTSDEDRCLHDHPWSFISILLNSGYWEHGDAGRKWVRRFSIIFRPALWRHRIEIVKAPTYTLVIRFKRFREWGFWTADGFVPWHKWWRANCE